MQIRSRLLFVAVASHLVLAPLAAKADSLRVKNGRQYALDLGRLLDVPAQEIFKAFQENRAGLPKDSNVNSVVSGLDSMAKMAGVACTYSSLFTTDKNVNRLYQALLRRNPTTEEAMATIKDTHGRFSYVANCMVVALLPEFILLKDGLM